MPGIAQPSGSSRRLHLLRYPEVSPSGEILLSSLIPTTFHSRRTSRSALPSGYLPPSWYYGVCRLLLPQLVLSAKVTTPVARQQVSPGKFVDFPCTLAQFTASALDCSGFVVIGQLAQPHGLTLGSCSSSCSFASGFLQTPPRGDALAFR
jgi:hypothetical protein